MLAHFIVFVQVHPILPSPLLIMNHLCCIAITSLITLRPSEENKTCRSVDGSKQVFFSYLGSIWLSQTHIINITKPTHKFSATSHHNSCEVAFEASNAKVEHLTPLVFFPIKINYHNNRSQYHLEIERLMISKCQNVTKSSYQYFVLWKYENFANVSLRRSFFIYRSARNDDLCWMDDQWPSATRSDLWVNGFSRVFYLKCAILGEVKRGVFSSWMIVSWSFAFVLFNLIYLYI